MTDSVVSDLLNPKAKPLLTQEEHDFISVFAAGLCSFANHENATAKIAVIHIEKELALPLSLIIAAGLEAIEAPETKQ